MSRNIILRGEGLWKRYPGEVRALEGVSLTIETGEIVAILGPSGAGKSTLLHFLGGLDHPTEGEVIFKEEISLYRISESERARIRNQEFGFVFQLYHLMPEFSALENVLLPALVARRSNKESRVNASALLERMGLGDRVDHRPSQLSGGEQQRVAIARALVNHPRVLLCDEPTGNLDSQTGHEIRGLLWELSRKEHQTLIIVTHDPEIAQRADRIVHMKDGRIVEEVAKVH